MKINDVVVFKHDAEIMPAFYVYEGTVGTIVDETVPNYYEVKIDDFGTYWVDGKHLSLLEAEDDWDPLGIKDFMKRAYSDHNFDWQELDPYEHNHTHYYNPYIDGEDYEPF